MIEYILYGLFAFLSFIASITVYFRKGQPGYLKLFPPFLFVSFVNNIVAYYTAVIYGTNHPVGNLYTAISVSFYLIIVSRIVMHLNARKLILYVAYVYVPVAATIFVTQGISLFNAKLFSLGALLIVMAAGYYFYEILKTDASRKLTRDPGFWICSALLFLYTTILPILGSVEFATKFPKFIVEIMGWVLQIIAYIFYLTLTVAFLCNVRFRKSSHL